MNEPLPPKPMKTALTDKPASATIIIVGDAVAGFIAHPRAYIADPARHIFDAKVRFVPRNKGRES